MWQQPRLPTVDCHLPTEYWREVMEFGRKAACLPKTAFDFWHRKSSYFCGCPIVDIQLFIGQAICLTHGLPNELGGHKWAAIIGK